MKTAKEIAYKYFKNSRCSEERMLLERDIEKHAQRVAKNLQKAAVMLSLNKMTTKKKKKSIAFKPLVIKSLPAEKEQETARIEWYKDFTGSDYYTEIFNDHEEMLHYAFDVGANWMKNKIVGKTCG